MQNPDIGSVVGKRGGAFAGNPLTSREIMSANLMRIGISEEERYQLILHEVYRRAEQKGFHHEISLQDWLAAEAHVDEMIDKMAAETIISH